MSCRLLRFKTLPFFNRGMENPHVSQSQGARSGLSAAHGTLAFGQAADELKVGPETLFLRCRQRHCFRKVGVGDRRLAQGGAD